MFQLIEQPPAERVHSHCCSCGPHQRKVKQRAGDRNGALSLAPTQLRGISCKKTVKNLGTFFMTDSTCIPHPAQVVVFQFCTR
jgi:hypothetical protein